MNCDARVQVDKAALDELSDKRRLETQSELGAEVVFNVWHKKWSGGGQTAKQFRSPFKCNIARDSGVTRSAGPYFCLWFARGCCHKGPACSFLHRLPNEFDALELNGANVTDCFGRTKFADAREDRNGIGSFLEPCQTLFVGYFSGLHTSREKLIEQLRLPFSEWGSITSVRISKNMKFAFITYKYQCNAEFAKEAMSNQTITGNETLSVRWAENSKRDDAKPELSLNEDLIRTIVRDTLKATRGKVCQSQRDDGNKLLRGDPNKVDEPQQPPPAVAPPDGELTSPSLLSEPPAKKRRGLVSYD